MSELEQKILKNPPKTFLEEKFHSLGFEQLTDIQKRALPIICQKIDSLIITPNLLKQKCCRSGPNQSFLLRQVDIP